MKNKQVFPLLAIALIVLYFFSSTTLFGKTSMVAKDDSPIVTLSGANYSSETSKGLVLVDFWAPWCGPCRKMNPVIEKLAVDYKGSLKVGKLNVDNNPQLARDKQIRGIPTIIVYKDGKEVTRIVGQTTKEEITKVLDGYISK